jgi:zinc protease
MKRRTLARGAGGWLLGAVTAGCATRATVPVAVAAGQAAARSVAGSAPPEPRLPEPGPLHLSPAPEVTEERLPDNGLTLIVAPRPGLPLVSVALMVRCGPAFDLPGRRGGCELMAALLIKGALRRGRLFESGALARQAEALGSAVSVRVEERLLVLEMTVLAPRAGEALALLSDLLRQPLLAVADLQAVRTQAREALALRLQDPAVLAGLVARRTAWGRHPLGRVTTPDSLMSVRREDVVALHRRCVRPDRVAVVLAGDLDRVQARGLVRAVMDGWRRPMEPFAQEPAPGSLAAAEWPEPLLPATLLVHLPSAAQSSVLVCSPFVGTDAADYPAGHLAAAVIGAGHSARLTQEIRIRRGLSYGVTGRLVQQRDTGLFITSAQTEHAHAADVATLMQTQLLALAQQQQPVGLAELVARRAALIGGFARQLDTTSGLVNRLGDDWAAGRSVEGLTRWPEHLEAVSPTQVDEFARRHWPAERLRTVIVGPLDRVFAATPPPAGAMRLDASALVLDSPTLRR